MKIAAEYAIQHLVEKCLPRFSPVDVVFHVQIDASFTLHPDDEHAEDDSINHRASINLLFHRPSNYTKVFWHVQFPDGPYKMLREIPKDAWKMESDHDSCWTSDGLSSPLHRVYMELRNKFPQERFREISEFVSFGLVSDKLFKVKIEKVKENAYKEAGAYTIELGDYAKSFPCDEETWGMMRDMQVLLSQLSDIPDSVRVYMKKVARQIEEVESRAKFNR